MAAGAGHQTVTERWRAHARALTQEQAELKVSAGQERECTAGGLRRATVGRWQVIAVASPALQAYSTGVTGVFPLQEVGDNMYKQYCIYSCLAQYRGIFVTFLVKGSNDTP